MSDILIHTEGGVTTLTLNRVGRKKSLTAAMYGQLADALMPLRGRRLRAQRRLLREGRDVSWEFS
jgi:enoyl-CoA hydratase/carnithine racemase